MKDKDIKEIVDETKGRINAYKKKPRKTSVKHYDNMDNTKFCYYLKNERMDLGLTQKEMAKRLGLSYQRYVNCENGKRPLINRRLRSILSAAECKILSKNGDIIFE